MSINSRKYNKGKPSYGQKNDPYASGIARGMDLSLELVREGGEALLASEMAIRKRTGIQPDSTLADLDKTLDSIIKHVMMQAFCLSVAAVHDVFGIGPKRMASYFEAYTEATKLLLKGRDGGALWTDYAAEIRQVYGVEIKAKREGVFVIPVEKPDKKQKKGVQ